ncbi:MAG: hypothetical protein M3364_01595 [Actinomycetota bacterium]|nr:hypothetical protein [Actinomycetota bacterium]
MLTSENLARTPEVAALDGAGLVVYEPVCEPDLLNDVERHIPLDLRGLLRPATHTPSAGSSIAFRPSKRRARSSLLVVKNTTTPTPGFAPSFCESGMPE